jgi:pimeloyl-ACP methyl ester carboxylesterase
MGESNRLPIVYIRGFADPGQIAKTVEDPFYGFNTGSTHMRAGESGDTVFYEFESPLLRLMIDHDYRLFVYGNQGAWLRQQPDGTVDPATIWIHRFYDKSSGSWRDRRKSPRGRQPESFQDEQSELSRSERLELRDEAPESFDIETAARELLQLIALIRVKTKAPRVHLIAHSMGGLICRCLIQKIIPDLKEAQPEHYGPATDYIDRLFTYATPHGGIEFNVGFGLLERLRDITGIRGTDIFGPARMWEYLTPASTESRPVDWEPQSIDFDAAEAFPKDRIFTLVGTDQAGFESDLAAWAVGPKSDGLVQTDSAYIPGARFAFVHRSHGGRHGIVSSEAGYQNLRRFLFGSLEATANLVGLKLPDADERSWQADVEVSIRGQSILMHEQVARHLCPVILEPPEVGGDQPKPLVTTFLIDDPQLRPGQHNENRYILKLRIFSLKERQDPLENLVEDATESLGRLFDFTDHQEQVSDFDDDLVIDIGTQNGSMTAWARWASQLDTRFEEYEPKDDGVLTFQDNGDEPRVLVAKISLPRKGQLLFGENAKIQLAVRQRP